MGEKKFIEILVDSVYFLFGGLLLVRGGIDSKESF